MNVDLGIWSKLTRVVLFLILVAVALGIIVWYLPLIRQNERMRKEILRLETRLQQEQEASKQLKAGMETLRTDPKAVERLARDKFGYAKPGETIIRFEEPATNTTAVAR